LPMVLRVPEGREEEASGKLRTGTSVNAACPDLLIRPSGPIVLNVDAVDEAIEFIGAGAADVCGTGCNIAVLDSGIDPGMLAIPGSLFPQQYDSQIPVNPGVKPDDRFGHGSLVGYIINRIAPAAKIFSVKVMDSTGAIGSLISGLYLAEATGPCHLLNMSLSVSCDGEPCPVCGTNVPAGVNAEQFRYFFKQFSQGKSAQGSAFIAAAGNHERHLKMPASFPEVLAVGSFDLDSRQPAEESRYHHVPPDRYILAPGGRHSGEKTLARAPGQSFSSNDALFGSSFATAFVTGVAARLICRDVGRGPCAMGAPPPSWQSHLAERLFSHLRETADRGWAEFDPELHGFGLLRYTGPSIFKNRDPISRNATRSRLASRRG
jgi:subtilisin family serine protease